MSAKFGRHIDVADDDGPVASTWLDSTDFECAFKWKITDENIIWRYKKLGYNLHFALIENSFCICIVKYIVKTVM